MLRRPVESTAQSGHLFLHRPCPLLRVKRTCRGHAVTSANDPKADSSADRENERRKGDETLDAFGRQITEGDIVEYKYPPMAGRIFSLTPIDAAIRDKDARAGLNVGTT